MDKNERKDEDFKDKSNIYQDIGPYLGTGLQLALTVAALVFLGRWLDNLTGKNPLFILIFSFLGVSAGMYNFIKTVIYLGKKKEK
jgi:F0F1-type ATP synthase assembly protein I